MSSTEPHSAPVANPEDAADVTDSERADVEPDSVEADSADQLRDARAIAAQLRTHAEQLSQLEGADLADHVEFYQSTHARLQRALSDIDNP